MLGAGLCTLDGILVVSDHSLLLHEVVFDTSRAYSARLVSIIVSYVDSKVKVRAGPSNGV